MIKNILYAFTLAMVILFSAPLISSAQPLPFTGIVIHHSATPQNITAKSIKAYHVNVRHYQDIGYNFVIESSGKIVEGRSMSIQGAHALNPYPSRNRTHIGICLVGMDHFTDAQFKSLHELIHNLMQQFDIKSIEPHHQECPGHGIDKNMFKLESYL